MEKDPVLYYFKSVEVKTYLILTYWGYLFVLSPDVAFSIFNRCVNFTLGFQITLGNVSKQSLEN